jgi:hypothetical protein
MTDLSKIKPAHVQRTAIVYVRQSTLSQVEQNRESTARQYALADRARELGWPKPEVVIIGEDLGLSGSSTDKRSGFARLTSKVALARVGIVLGLEVSRLARNNADWYRLLQLCGVTRGVYCLNVGGAVIERAVAAAFLEAVTPVAIAATMLSVQQLQANHDAALSQWRLEVERARYEAERAERPLPSRGTGKPGWLHAGWRPNGRIARAIWPLPKENCAAASSSAPIRLAPSSSNAFRGSALSGKSGLHRPSRIAIARDPCAQWPGRSARA